VRLRLCCRIPIFRRGIRGLGRAAFLPLGFELEQNPLDAVLILDAFVEFEPDLWNAPQADLGADLAAKERRRADQRALGVLPLRASPIIV
jgi:hypothetical protein